MTKVSPGCLTVEITDESMSNVVRARLLDQQIKSRLYFIDYFFAASEHQSDWSQLCYLVRF